jgi:hypothetical protein
MMNGEFLEALGVHPLVPSAAALERVAEIIGPLPSFDVAPAIEAAGFVDLLGLKTKMVEAASSALNNQNR